MTLQLLQCLLPDSNLLRLEHYDIDQVNEHLTLNGILRTFGEALAK